MCFMGDGGGSEKVAAAAAAAVDASVVDTSTPEAGAGVCEISAGDGCSEASAPARPSAAARRIELKMLPAAISSATADEEEDTGSATRSSLSDEKENRKCDASS